MVSIALAMHATDETGAVVPGGHVYIMFDTATIKAGDLLLERLRAEIRKALVVGVADTSLELLAGYNIREYDDKSGHILKGAVLDRFIRGEIQVTVDGAPIPPYVTHIISLTRKTVLRVVVPLRKDLHAENDTPPDPVPDAPDALGSSRRR
jgi:hypothetical protein